ncbi:gluconokinase [Glaciibacter psychrotolerans]|uniref:Gluconokinase n=1 Tax=Glaciibacter psychrotolerans TaxID=670054 RepID=A0A7Z0EE69_9MICO|nr:gluconokinase [Leifsonia psychrotolerans]NYJ19873.1 gluconokinase [Leifsonia psychrotolerans]
MSDEVQYPICVMGVQGSGKSTIGRALAQSLGLRFFDGDDLHSVEAKAKMASGLPLTDDDRLPWLVRVAAVVADALAHGEPIVIACSALKRSYRDLMRETVPTLRFAQLEGSQELIAERLTHRNHEYMPSTLLDSQFATLEPLAADEAGTRVSLTLTPDEIVGRLTKEIGR